ncbi:hemerythrin domain-containing protein [Paraburkholderia nemoris]|uniref:hemerythrin domain-containing protein n=1 Tax=Paraburkholderia nemoris TaxID=2793076 RepID=UPI0038BD6CAF
MPTIIERLLAEHGRLGRLVQLLNGERSLPTDPGSPNIALQVDTLYDLTRFPDVAHHAIEDRITEKLRGKNALSGEFAWEIEAQHVTLILQGHELLQGLEAAAREENMSQERGEIHVRLYAERLRHNMTVEELTLFPAAVRYLDELLAGHRACRCGWTTVSSVRGHGR